jgi:hypothetical protein
MPDCVSLVRYGTCPGIVSSVHSGTGLTECRTDWHFYIYVHAARTCTQTCNMNINMQHGLVNAAWIWTVDMHGCRNANKKLSPA